MAVPVGGAGVLRGLDSVGPASHRPPSGARRSAGAPAITPSLDAASRVSGNPHGWQPTRDRVSWARSCLGLGFTMEPERAQALIEPRPAQRRRACSLPQRSGPQLAPGFVGQPVGDQLSRLVRGAGPTYPRALCSGRDGWSSRSVNVTERRSASDGGNSPKRRHGLYDMRSAELKRVIVIAHCQQSGHAGDCANRAGVLAQLWCLRHR